MSQNIVEIEKHVRSIEKQTMQIEKTFGKKDNLTKKNPKIIMEVTDYETRQIQNILRKWIPKFKEKIKKDIALLKMGIKE